MSKWTEIHADFIEDGVIHIDAWTTSDDNEDGRVIAKIYPDGSVEYRDIDAETDEFAQELIQGRLKEMQNNS